MGFARSFIGKRHVKTLMTSVGGSLAILLSTDREDRKRFAQAQAPGMARDLDKWSQVGLPGGETTYMFRENFVVCYDARTRNPRWVMERITRDTCRGEADRRVVSFYEEESIDPSFRSKNSDYLNSGYDRGHMAPAANNRSSVKTMEETFTLANVSPQVGGGFNRDYWARVEKFTRDLTKRCQSVYLVSGPLFLPRQKQAGDAPFTSNPTSKARFIMSYELLGDPPGLVAVPTHFFKCVLAEVEGRYLVAAFVLPNAPIPPEVPLTRFLVPLENLEQAAGVRFFAQALSQKDKERLDGRVQLLRGTLGGEEGGIAGLLAAQAPSTALVTREGYGHDSGRWGKGRNKGGLRLNLAGPEHLCEALACQLPPERFWELTDGRAGGGNGGGRRKRGGDTTESSNSLTPW